MDLKSGYPYWSIRNGLMADYPPLQADQACEVAIVGGGVTGALLAHELVAHGHDVVLLEQRDIAWGSTSASTALLQYEIDTPMTELARRHGLDNAVLAYQACAEAIGELGALARSVGQVDFRRSDSLYYASRRRDVRGLDEEGELRRRHGLDARRLDQATLHERYGLVAPAALVTGCAGRLDPYRLTHRLLARARRAGARIHDRVRVARIDVLDRHAVLHTESGLRVRARHAILAAGYANQAWLGSSVARNRSSYAFVTDPLPAAALGRLRDTLLWETARPYLYLRSTGDGRLIVGGEDDALDLPRRRDARVPTKAAKLCRKVAKVLPGLHLQPAFAWGGTFAETADGLPFFGPHPEHGPRLLFAMAYGGNGITYSQLGAGLLRALIERRPHRLRELFGFARLG